MELKTNGLREKCGQEPSSRVSLLLPDDDVTFEDGALSLGGKSESEKSFISDGEVQLGFFGGWCSVYFDLSTIDLFDASFGFLRPISI